MDNIDRVKPFYKVTVKVKNKHKAFWVNVLELASSFIHLKGAEIEETSNAGTLEEAKALLETNNQVEKYYPWDSVVEIDLKRFLKSTQTQ
ncbi:MAG: hypothetical protein ACOYMA_00210 [Bacteroidia bacterium]